MREKYLVCKNYKRYLELTDAEVENLKKDKKELLKMVLSVFPELKDKIDEEDVCLEKYEKNKKRGIWQHGKKY